MTTNITPIAFSANDTYVPYLYVCIRSLIEHVSEQNIYHLYVLHTDVSDENKSILHSLSQANVSIFFVDVSEHLSAYQKNLFYVHNTFTVETYYRLFLPDILSSLNRIIYIDCDTLVQKDVAELFNIDLGDAYIAATRDLEIIRAANCLGAKYSDYFTKKLGLMNISNYFQAGVMVMNLEKIKKNNFQQKFLDAFFKIQNPKFVDQDILNIVYEGRVKFIAQNWNYTWHLKIVDKNYFQHLPIPFNEEYEKAKEDPYIIHFTGEGYKPSDYPLLLESSLFVKYIVDSPFFNWFYNKLIISTKDKLEKIKIKKQKLRKYSILKNITCGCLHKKYLSRCLILEQQIKQLDGCNEFSK